MHKTITCMDYFDNEQYHVESVSSNSDNIELKIACGNALHLTSTGVKELIKFLNATIKEAKTLD